MYGSPGGERNLYGKVVAIKLLLAEKSATTQDVGNFYEVEWSAEMNGVHLSRKLFLSFGLH